MARMTRADDQELYAGSIASDYYDICIDLHTNIVLYKTRQVVCCITFHMSGKWDRI